MGKEIFEKIVLELVEWPGDREPLRVLCKIRHGYEIYWQGTIERRYLSRIPTEYVDRVVIPELNKLYDIHQRRRAWNS